MKTSLEEYLAKNFTSAKNEIDEVTRHFKNIKKAKNELLVREGETCKYFYFVINGCVRNFFIDANGQEATRYIAFENQFITTIHSFIDQIPSNENICTVEPSELLAISYNDFKLVNQTIPLFKDLYIKQLERAYITHHWRVQTFLIMDAKQRYDYLLQNQAKMVQRLSNKMLASFMGITQESLSRLKSKK